MIVDLRATNILRALLMDAQIRELDGPDRPGFLLRRLPDSGLTKVPYFTVTKHGITEALPPREDDSFEASAAEAAAAFIPALMQAIRGGEVVVWCVRPELQQNPRGWTAYARLATVSGPFAIAGGYG